MLPLGSKIYFPRVEEQLFRKHRMQPPQHQHDQSPTISSLASYKTFTSDQLASHLFTNLIGRSLDARHLSPGERNTYFSGLKTTLLHFCEGAPFVQDILDLTSFLEQGCDNEELLGAYVQKIAAIHGEKYEEAGTLLQKIRQLSSH